MGMALSANAGYGVLVPLERDKEEDYEDPSEWLERTLDSYEYLSFDVGRFSDYVLGAAIFVQSTVESLRGGEPIALDDDLFDSITSAEYKELRDVAAELEIEFDPKYITVVSYW